MGYYSDVRIKAEFKEKVSKARVKGFVKEFNDILEIDKILYNESENSVILAYNSVKWYEGSFDDVDAIMELIEDKGDNIEDNSSILDGLQYIRIGEDSGDTEERFYGFMKDAMWIETSCNFEEKNFIETNDFLQ